MVKEVNKYSEPQHKSLALYNKGNNMLNSIFGIIIELLKMNKLYWKSVYLEWRLL